MDKQVVVAFLGLFAKRAYAAILSTTPPQSIHRPKPILQCQPWFFTFGGAHAFQTILLMGDSMRLKNCNLYAEAAEYCPLPVSFHRMSSSTSSIRCTVCMRAQSCTNCVRCSIDMVASVLSFLIYSSSGRA
jgi:hypothetical protein